MEEMLIMITGFSPVFLEDMTDEDLEKLYIERVEDRG